MARSGLRAIERSLAQILALSGLPMEEFSGLQTCDSHRFRHSALSPIVTPPCLLLECFIHESHTRRLDVGPGETALPARAYLAPDTCQTRRFSGDPISA